MKLIKTVSELKEIIKKNKDKEIGLVPTMGALHLGHQSLIKKSLEQNEFCVVSVFVNPTQFGPNEDYEKYPRTLDKDCRVCEELGVDVVFAPSADEMYEDFKNTTLVCPSFKDVDKLCGKSRPGHFDGVGTVVSKLFNLVKPKRAYFGKKDAQQLFIIKKMVRDLNFDVEIVPCPIVREEDGLALSSRNTYLDSDTRVEALKLSKALYEVKKQKEKGVIRAADLTDIGLKVLEGLDVEYFEILELSNFEKIDIINKDAIVLCAVRFLLKNNHVVRLIDNMEI